MTGVSITYGHGVSTISLENDGGKIPLIEFVNGEPRTERVKKAADDLRAYASALDAVADADVTFGELADIVSGFDPNKVIDYAAAERRKVTISCLMCFFGGVSVGISAVVLLWGN